METRKLNDLGVVDIEIARAITAAESLCVYCDAIISGRTSTCKACRDWLGTLASEQQARLDQGLEVDSGWTVVDGKVGRRAKDWYTDKDGWRQQPWHLDRELQQMRARLHYLPVQPKGKRVTLEALDVGVGGAAIQPKPYNGKISPKNYDTFEKVRAMHLTTGAGSRKIRKALAGTNLPARSVIDKWLKIIKEEVIPEDEMDRLHEAVGARRMAA